MNELNELKLQLKEEQEKVKKLEQMILEITSPIIQSIIPQTILVPIVGNLHTRRIENIIEKLLHYSSLHDVDAIIIDFSAIKKDDIEEVVAFGKYIDHLTGALSIVGLDVYYVGFTPEITKILIQSGLSVSKDIKTFLSFNQALKWLMKVKGLEFKENT